MEGREVRYVREIFLDISSAFDHISWTPLIEDIVSLGTSPTTVAITHSYLVNRSALLMIGNVIARTMLMKGCHLGSEFGPALWRIAINNVLATLIEKHCHRVVYADDIVTLVAANTRRELVQRAEKHLRDLQLWSRRYTLSFLTQKSTELILKSQLVHGFTVGFGDERIKTTDTVKYLGIRIGTRFCFKRQIADICESSADMFNRLRSTRCRE